MKKKPNRKMEISYIPDDKNKDLALKAILRIVQLAIESKNNLDD